MINQGIAISPSKTRSVRAAVSELHSHGDRILIVCPVVGEQEHTPR